MNSITPEIMREATLTSFKEAINSGVDEKKRIEVGKKVAAIIGNLFQFGSEEHAVSSIEHAKNFSLELLQIQGKFSDISSVRQNYSKTLSDDQMNRLEAAVLDSKIPPNPSEAISVVQQDSANGLNSPDEIQDAAQSQVDNSSELHQQLSNAKAQALEPLFALVHAQKPENIKTLFGNILKTLAKHKGEEGQVDIEKLTALNKELAEIANDFSPEKLEAFMEKQDPATQHALYDYWANVIGKGLSGGQELYVAEQVPQKLQGEMAYLLKVQARELESRPQPATKQEIETLSIKRDFIAKYLVLIAKNAQAALKQNPNFDSADYMANAIGSLQTQIGGQEGVTIKIYKEDLLSFAEHLNVTKEKKPEQNNADLKAFIDQYGKYGLMAIPMILGPLATAISHIPVIGRPLASLAPMINNITSQFGPVIIGMLVARGGNAQAATNQNQEVQDLQQAA